MQQILSTMLGNSIYNVLVTRNTTMGRKYQCSYCQLVVSVMDINKTEEGVGVGSGGHFILIRVMSEVFVSEGTERKLYLNRKLYDHFHRA